MPILETLLGKPAAQPIEAIGRVIDDLFTSDEERLGKEALLARLAQRPALAQIEVNRVEARHRSVFVAGYNAELQQWNRFQQGLGGALGQTIPLFAR